jgi:pyruvate/2-oxoglutarate dehydrogenase complex dihydrolipoamide acyltransferase (E2) component
LFRKPFGPRIVQFERADVSLPITRVIDGAPVTFIGTIRGAACKSLPEIQKELTAYQRGPIDRSPDIRRYQRLARLPFWITQWIHRRLTRDPALLTRTAGTCGLTLLDGDWGDTLFPVAPTSVMFGIGAARREPVVRDGQIVIRRMLKVCLMVDNYVIPGVLAARLGKCFKELIESGAVVEGEPSPTGTRRPTIVA